MLIPANTAQCVILRDKMYFDKDGNLVQIIPTATSEKGVEVQCLKW